MQQRHTDRHQQADAETALKQDESVSRNTAKMAIHPPRYGSATGLRILLSNMCWRKYVTILTITGAFYFVWLLPRVPEISLEGDGSQAMLPQ